MNHFFRYTYDAIIEIFDTILYTIIVTFTYVYIVRLYSDISYILFPIVPLFILYSPFIKRVQKKSLLELIIKTIIYLLIALVVFAMSYTMFCEILIESGFTFIGLIFFILSLILLISFIRKTIKFNSVPKSQIYYDRNKSIKVRLISFVIAVFAWGFTVQSFRQYLNPRVDDYFTTTVVMFLVSVFGLLFSIIATAYFIFSLFDRYKSIKDA